MPTLRLHDRRICPETGIVILSIIAIGGLYLRQVVPVLPQGVRLQR